MCEILEQMRNESYQSGWIKGKEVGKQEGIIQKQIAIVKELLMEGSLSLKTIVKVSGMSLEEVIKTKKSMLKT